MYPMTSGLPMMPVAKARSAVRGLRRSIAASSSRFAAIANVRNVTIATITHPNSIQFGQPSATMNAAATANGKAKIECSNLMVSRNI